MADYKLVDFKRMKEVYGIPYSRQHIDRLCAENRFPPKRKIGLHRTCWLASEVEAWIADKLETEDRSSD